MVEKPKNDLPKIGYVYHYPNPGHPTEKFRLDIHISSEPTEQHFDVLRTYFFVQSLQGVRTRLTVTHPWNYEQEARVCAGVVVMEDRKGEKEEAFSFGGQLQIDGQESQTVCKLVSTAPILEISGATPLHRFFIEEIEIVLAIYQASDSDHKEYEKRLCQTEPLMLYLACLEELIKKFESMPHKDEKYQQLLIYLHTEKHRLSMIGMIGKPMPTLSDVFENKG